MRKVLHIDADCFYAAVEVRDNPLLAGKAIAVGGDPGRRGVISTCSYEARRFGVRSAMASAQALKLCPDLHIISPDFQRYKVASSAMRAIFDEYSEAIEPLSLDEAYLDVSASDLCRGSATWIASEIQQRVKKEVGISVSCGAAPVKFLAKIASDWNKPRGLFVIKPEQVEAFTATLPVAKLPGVGPVTARKLATYGLERCVDIRQIGLAAMQEHFGSLGPHLYERAWGRDDSPVCASRGRKSLSVERTFAEDRGASELNLSVGPLFEDLSSRFKKLNDDFLPSKYFVKLKFCDFSQTTLESTLPSSWSWPSESAFGRLLHAAWHRAKKPVRLIGLGLRFNSSDKNRRQFEQLSLF